MRLFEVSDDEEVAEQDLISVKLVKRVSLYHHPLPLSHNQLIIDSGKYKDIPTFFFLTPITRLLTVS